jgi:uncharacterized membrane protein YgcG
MKVRKKYSGTIFSLLVMLLLIPSAVLAQEQEVKPISQKELDQMLAPIALYPDPLLAQVLMASTYPLEIVQADRFAKKNKDLKGQKLLEAAKNQNWDPTVKSLLEFPDILSMMSDQLDWTTRLGDAFLSQQKDVMESVQRLRKRAHEASNLKTSKEQKVIVEKETIIIQPVNPEVIYVPVYNPTIVYGVWAYPAYPPYPYYPPGYVAGVATFSFFAGVAIGSSGCCWGSCNWGHYDIDIDINRQNNFTKNNYDKDKVSRHQQRGGQQGDKQKWQHNPEHRKGVAYSDNATGRRFNRGSSSEAIRSREAFRGRTEPGRQEPGRGVPDRSRQDLSRGGTERGDGAFSGIDRGSSAKDFSNRGSSSRQSISGDGGGFGGSRGGGGFSPGGKGFGGGRR